MAILTKHIAKQTTEKDLTGQELTFLLNLISKSTFEGRDVLLLNSIVTKITEEIKAHETGTI
jgi:hypothetical protein